jgi:hypothetical protein
MYAFIDVLVFLGDRSLASCLAGGDLDGCVVIVWLDTRTAHEVSAIHSTYTMTTNAYSPRFMRRQQSTPPRFPGRWTQIAVTLPSKIFVISLSNTSTVTSWYVLFCVCSLVVHASMSSTGPAGRQAHRYCRSIKCAALFIYKLSRSHPAIGWRVRSAMHETRQIL